MRKKEKYETIFPTLWYVVGIESASLLSTDFDLLTLSESSGGARKNYGFNVALFTASLVIAYNSKD